MLSEATYNSYRITFPNSLFAKKTQLRKLFKYFEYNYEVNNEKMMLKKKENKDWVKNGRDFLE